MESIRDKKLFNVIVGAATLYLLFILWRDGWADWLFSDRESSDGYSNTQLWIAIGSALIQFLEIVGIITVGCVSGVLPHVTSVLGFAAKKLSEVQLSLISWIKNSRGKERSDSDWDWRPLAAIILSYVLWSGGQLSSIWENIKGLIPDRIITEVERPTSAIFFIDDETITQNQRAIATSLLVSDLIESKGVERRMLSSSQTYGTSEPWVKEVVDFADDDSSSLVLYYPDGNLSSIKIPESVEDIRELVGAW